MNGPTLTSTPSTICVSGSARTVNQDTNQINKENNMSSGSMTWWKFIDKLDRELEGSKQEGNNDNR